MISTFPSAAFPPIDLGGSTGVYRMGEQAFINSEIFTPLARSGHPVIHADLKAAVGVDVVIDFTRKIDRSWPRPPLSAAFSVQIFSNT